MIGFTSNRRHGSADIPRLGIWLAALAIGGALGWWGRGAAIEAAPGSALRVGHVAVTGVDRVPASELIALAGLSAGQRLPDIDAAAIRDALLRHPWVRDARVTTLPPDHVLMAIDERRAAAIVATPDARRFVDADGVPFAPADGADDLAVIEGVDSAALGVENPLLVQALRLLAAADAEGLPAPQRVVLDGPDPSGLPALVWDRSPGASLTAFVGSEAPGPALRKLARVWMADLEELRNAREVDLRFGRQLILRGDAGQATTVSMIDDAPARSAAVTGHAQGGEPWHARTN